MKIILNVFNEADAKKAVRETQLILSQMTTECGGLIEINQELCNKDETVIGHIEIKRDVI